MRRILLVDDDSDMLMITSRWLSKAGYDVVAASSGREALSLLQEDSYDLVLLDYAMPDMDGKKTLEAIRQVGSDIKVLFRTGKDDLDVEEIVGSCHANGFISKADGKPKLIEAIKRQFGEV